MGRKRRRVTWHGWRGWGLILRERRLGVGLLGGAAGEKGGGVALEEIGKAGDGGGGLAELLEGEGGFAAEAALGVDEALGGAGGFFEGGEGRLRLLKGGGELRGGGFNGGVDLGEGAAEFGEGAVEVVEGAGDLAGGDECVDGGAGGSPGGDEGG